MGAAGQSLLCQHPPPVPLWPPSLSAAVGDGDPQVCSCPLKHAAWWRHSPPVDTWRLLACRPSGHQPPRSEGWPLPTVSCGPKGMEKQGWRDSCLSCVCHVPGGFTQASTSQCPRETESKRDVTHPQSRWQHKEGGGSPRARGIAVCREGGHGAIGHSQGVWTGPDAQPWSPRAPCRQSSVKPWSWTRRGDAQNTSGDLPCVTAPAIPSR